ncbi:hypothetical protein FVE85_3537 [Porphyridium purpureum]|uniref:Uncharacterized protein n=1 Tax=Porphyridium purpureum TaxID=35688 RepID=A0A5J4YKU9_PORPP|nr:hypothetical protein FVE85_3537 [Porphyridium purpureum]|eukprot:POR2228..scf249_10
MDERWMVSGSTGSEMRGSICFVAAAATAAGMDRGVVPTGTVRESAARASSTTCDAVRAMPRNRRHAACDGVDGNARVKLVAATCAVAAVMMAPAAVSAAFDPGVVVGTYTDPVNHPGGTRTVALTDTRLGGFTLAKVFGKGGRGEPKEYELPAMVFKCPPGLPNDAACITIDFRPKGGPNDFTGYFDADKKGIQFPADGNFWPKQ